MQFQLTNQYSPSEIYEARDEILKLQTNLNKIEQLYQTLYSTLNNQQNHVEGIEISVEQTETNLEKGGLDLYEILQIQKKKDKHRCFIIIFICTIGCFFLLIVFSVLVNVIKTFGFQPVFKSNNDK